MRRPHLTLTPWASALGCRARSAAKIVGIVDRPISLVILGVVACLLVLGTFALLALGRPVPEPVWVAWGVVITALFGHGVFLAQSAAHQAVIGDLMEGVRTGVAAASPVTTSTTVEAQPTRPTTATGAEEVH